MPQHIGAIFFDLDGTLLNTLDDLADTANTALMENGFPAHPVEAFRYFVGDGIENMLRRAAPEGTEQEVLTLLVERTRVEYARHWARRTLPYEGIMPMLDRLETLPRPSAPALAVLSNKPHEFTEVVISHFFPRVPFCKVQGSPRGGKAKPDPFLALQMAKELGVAPENVLFMGDSRTDMDTATAAGMIPAGALWGFRPKEELVAHGARVLLEKPEDVFAYL